jgi:hypothetical protein
MVKRASILWAVGLILVVINLGIAAVFLLRILPVRAAPASPLAGATYPCTPNLVVSANVRVVVRCTSGYVINPTTTIIWFAYPTSDSANASRMLSVFETAKATGATVTVYFDTADTSGASYGCDPTNCRAIWAVTTP